MNPFSTHKPFIEEDVAVLEEIQPTDINELVVYNDDVNTFEHVIETLIKVCKHTADQAEQCTLIIHHKGKCIVKNGTFEALKPMRQGICDRGISAEIM